MHAACRVLKLSASTDQPLRKAVLVPVPVQSQLPLNFDTAVSTCS